MTGDEGGKAEGHTSAMNQLPDIRDISPADFMMLGLQQIAYVKAVTDDEGKPCYGVHAADGEVMAVFETREIAFAAVTQHDLEPLSAH